MTKNNQPLYMQIIEYIKAKINENELKTEEKVPTEEELRKMFNVSRVTSNRALVELEREGLIYRIRGSGSFVAPKNNNNSQKNSNVYNNLISLILPFDTSRGRIIDVIKGATEYLSKYGYYLSVHSTKGSYNKEKDLIQDLVEKKIAGIIYYPLFSSKNIALINNLYLAKFPIVAIDKYFENISISYVVSDNFKGGYLATEHLIRLGHQIISFLSGGIEERNSVRERYFGYCKALNDYGCCRALKENNTLFRSDIINLCNKNESKKFKYKLNKNINQIVKDLYEQGVTGFVAESDYAAIDLAKTCQQVGIQIPNQISIVGFGNIDLSDELNVPLTTIEQNFYEIGSKAAEIIIKTIEDKKFDFEQVKLPVKLIKRHSTSKNNNGK